MKINKYFFIASCLMLGLTGCKEESPVTNPPVDHTQIVMPRGEFAKGADVSWLTQQEKEGYTWNNSNGVETECMQLLRDDIGVNSIRLRVWVNPEEGWCNTDDLLVKAVRANRLGLRVMVDFHLSDVWADPGQQITPAAWADKDLEGLKGCVAEHVKDVLGRMQRLGVEPEWVQVGNEVTPGFMLPLGSIENPQNFTALVNAGYEAVKSVFPDCAVIVHIDGGDNWWRYDRIFGALKDNGGKYDMIGVSLYPDASSWKSTIDSFLANVDKAQTTYQKPVMVCEIGMEYYEAEASQAMMDYIYEKSKGKEAVKGIFWWEPQSPEGYNGGYNKGCFENGSHNGALNCFSK